MTDLPPIAVLFATYNRAEYAEKTLDAALERLVYPDVRWYLADAGSEDDQQIRHIVRINESGGDKNLGGHSHKLTPGMNWNKGINHIFNSGIDIYLRLEDDFVLSDVLDIRPYVELLLTQESIGQVRLGLFPINLTADSVGYAGRMYLDIRKETQYAYSGNPCLIHRRFHDAYGYFDEQLGPGDCEIAMDGSVRRKDGPRIVWPMELGPYSVWSHIGERQSYQ